MGFKFERQFKISFPVIRMPVNRGGKPAIVVFSLNDPAQPNVFFVTAVDIDGGVHQQVPIVASEVRAAAINPVNFVEVDRIEAPTGHVIKLAP